MKLSYKKILPSILVISGLVALPAGQAAATVFNDLTTYLASTGPQTLIDFETTGTGGVPTNGADIGSTYSGLDFDTGNFFESGFGSPVSGSWGWLSNNADGTARIFAFDFTMSGVTSVGVHNVLNGGIPSGSELSALAFDASGSLLETVLSDAVGDTKDFFGVTTLEDIARVEIRVDNAGGWGLDDRSL